MGYLAKAVTFKLLVFSTPNHFLPPNTTVQPLKSQQTLKCHDYLKICHINNLNGLRRCQCDLLLKIDLQKKFKLRIFPIGSGLIRVLSIKLCRSKRRCHSFVVVLVGLVIAPRRNQPIPKWFSLLNRKIDAQWVRKINLMNSLYRRMKDHRPSQAETRNKRELSKRALSKIMMERGKSIAFTHNFKR